MAAVPPKRLTLIRHLLFFEYNPDALDEWTEPASIELERLFISMCIDKSLCRAAG